MEAPSHYSAQLTWCWKLACLSYAQLLCLFLSSLWKTDSGLSSAKHRSLVVHRGFLSPWPTQRFFVCVFGVGRMDGPAELLFQLQGRILYIHPPGEWYASEALPNQGYCHMELCQFQWDTVSVPKRSDLPVISPQRLSVLTKPDSCSEEVTQPSRSSGRWHRDLKSLLG